MPIRILTPEVAAKIAAGEVVERPASVVKELLDNAIDAGARRIDIEVRGGGLDLIRVSDDGCGIAPEDLELALARYATSKLARADDLERIATLGFRGEALPSIAAVADLELTSRPPDSPAAAYLKSVDGQVMARGSRGAPAGTTVAVQRLFDRLPARRKFLRSPQAEAQHIARVVGHYALAYPEVRFSLRLDGRQTLLAPGNGDPRDVAAAVYGTEVAAGLLPLIEFSGPIAVTGLLAPPHLSRASRGYISVFVNRRWVQHRRLAFAVEEAYQGLLQVGRYPIAIVDLRLPLEEVDVNVHPTKAEVRLRDEGAAFAAVQRAVRQTLLAGAPVPAVAASAPDSAPLLSLSPQAAAPLLWEQARAPAARPQSQTVQTAPTPRVALPTLRVIGQLGSTYIVAEGPDGMYLIDQHAAHERVLFEAIVARRQGQRPEMQGLLEPVLIEVTPAQEAALRQQGEALAEYGFAIEPFGPRAYLVRAVPSLMASGDVRQSLLAFLDLLAEEEGVDSRDRVAISLACHGAIRAGKTLSMEEMRELVRQLEVTQAPHTCPHGRPTMIHLRAELLAREFGRR